MKYRLKNPFTAALFCVGLLALAACDKPADDAATATEPAKSLAAASDAPAGAYTLDKSHASLIFRVSHLGYSNYTGRFTGFDATLGFDPKNPAAMTFSGTVDPKSLTLDNPPAGFVNDLLGAMWLDAEKYPVMTFTSTRVEPTGDYSADVTGDFTMHGVTKPLTLAVTFNGGYAGHPYDPNARIGFSAHGTLKRSDFGITYGIPEAGSSMGVSDEVELLLESEFSGPAWQSPEAPAAPAP
ncbi:MAG: YceI family protein [Parvibaculum sp.]|nr:YceI family protein [Parvibaculum sp.]